MSRKFNTTSLEHNCIPATCCDDVCSVQALSGIDNGRFQEVPTAHILHHPQGLYSCESLHTPAMPFHTGLLADV
jgi:hypothetical protein